MDRIIILLDIIKHVDPINSLIRQNPDGFMSNRKPYYFFSSQKSLLETVSIVFLIYSSLIIVESVVMLTLGFTMGGLFSPESGNWQGFEGKINPYQRWIFCHLSLVSVLKVILSLACFVISLGILKKHAFFYKAFRICLLVLIVMKLWNMGWSLADAIYYYPNQLGPGFLGKINSIFTGVYALWHGVFAWMCFWVYEKFGQQEMVRMFRKEKG